MEELERMDGEIAAYTAAAQRHANGFWSMLVIGGLLWYFWSVWAAAIPAGLGVLAILLSAYCTTKAVKIERTRAFWKARLDAAS